MGSAGKTGAMMSTVSTDADVTSFLGVSGLCKRFDGKAVLDGVSFELPQGQVSVLMGPSGGGKTTLLRCLDLLEPFDDGRISYRWLGMAAGSDGRCSQAEQLRVRRAVGFVFQDHNLWLGRTVLDNLTLAPRAVLGESREAAEERARGMLSRFDLKAKEGAWAWQLSGGQRQRVAIIRALMMQPELILLDEVTSGLDPLLIVDVLDLLRELKHEGRTMLVVTHQLDFARSFGDAAMLLADGKVAERGMVSQVIDAPQSEAARDFFRVLRRGR